MPIETLPLEESENVLAVKTALGISAVSDAALAAKVPQSVEIDGPPLRADAMIVTGSLTDGENPVVFPPLYEEGTFGGKPFYLSNSDSSFPLYGVSWQSTFWELAYQDGVDTYEWTSSEAVATPDLVTTWTAASPATGTPSVDTAEETPAVPGQRFQYTDGEGVNHYFTKNSDGTFTEETNRDASNVEEYKPQWREALGFGPADDEGVRDVFRAAEGLAVDYPFFVQSSHIDATSPGERPVLGFSRDGHNFTEISVNYTPPTGDGTRDCSAIRIRGRWYMFYTSGEFGVCEYFGIAVSDDLINWTHFTDVVTTASPPDEDSTRTWAPDPIIVDNTIYVLFCRDTSAGNFRTHWVSASLDDLTTWTNAELVGLTGGPSSAKLDPCVLAYDGGYLMVVRYYGANGMLIFRSETSPVSGYTFVSHVGTDRTMEGGSLVHMGFGRIRLYFIDTPGGAANQSYMDSLDGGVTFGAITAAEGDIEVPHMTVRSYLDPNASAAITPRRTNIANDARFVMADGLTTLGQYGMRRTMRFMVPPISPPSLGTPFTSYYYISPADLGMDGLADYTTRVFSFTLRWRSALAYKLYNIAVTKLGTGFVSVGSPIPLFSVTGSYIETSLVTWADGQPIKVEGINNYGDYEDQLVVIKIEEIIEEEN